MDAAGETGPDDTLDGGGGAEAEDFRACGAAVVFQIDRPLGHPRLRAFECPRHDDRFEIASSKERDSRCGEQHQGDHGDSKTCGELHR
jgi:hypothetical protein